MDDEELQVYSSHSYDWLSQETFYKIVDDHLAKVHPRFRDKNIVDDDLARRAIEVLESTDTKLHRDIRQWVQRNFNLLTVDNHKYLASKSEKRGKIGLKVVVRSKMYEIVCGIHDKDHVGQNGTWLNFRKDWTGVPQHVVKEVVNQCAKCQGHIPLRNPGSSGVRPIISARFLQRVQTSVIQMTSRAPDGYFYVVHLHDYYSKWSWLRALKDNGAKAVAATLLEIFLEWGCPTFLEDGDGRELALEYINELMQLWPECKILHGQTQAQEFMGNASHTLKEQVNIWMESTGRSDWNVGLPLIVHQMNREVSSVTGVRPYDVVFRRDQAASGFIDDLWEQGYRDETDLPATVVVEYGTAQVSDYKKMSHRRKASASRMHNRRVDSTKHGGGSERDLKEEERERKRPRTNGNGHADNDSNNVYHDNLDSGSDTPPPESSTRSRGQSSLLTGLYSWVWPPANK